MKQQLVQLNSVIEALTEITNDLTVPKNIREKIQTAINALTAETDSSVKKDKAIQQLDEVAEDTNLQAYTRTQVWSIVSMLERL